MVKLITAWRVWLRNAACAPGAGARRSYESAAFQFPVKCDPAVGQLIPAVSVEP